MIYADTQYDFDQLVKGGFFYRPRKEYGFQG